MVFKGMLTVCLMVMLLLIPVYGQAKTPLDALMQDLLSYFPVVSGKVVSQDGKGAVIDKGSKDNIKQGMRVHIFREDASFVHPVTREYLGKVQKPIGVAEVVRVMDNRSEVTLLDKEAGDIKGALFKVSTSKIVALFCQTEINWSLAEHYYRMLKEGGRFELIDSASEAADLAVLTEEARKKGADIVIVIDSKKGLESTKVRQRVVWSKDAKTLSEREVTLEAGYVQSLIAKSRPVLFGDSNILLSYQVSPSIKKIAIGDIDGEGSPEVILATATSLSVYQPSADLKLLWDFQTSLSEEILWIDTLPIEGSRQEAIIVVTYRDGEVTSSIYLLKAGTLSKVAERKDAFLRRYGNSMLEQGYSKRDGFDGRVFNLRFTNGQLVRGEAIRLPERVNIYDFSPIESPEGKKGFLVWDEKGVINLYSSTGIISWSSGEDLGGFSTVFKKESIIPMLDRGEWSIKDRMVPISGGVLVPVRKPILGMAKGLGYKESAIRFLWWNGLSVEQFTVADKLDGEVLDYGLLNDRLIVLCKPIMGVKVSNILKGANPFVYTLYVISVRGIYD